VRVTKRKIMIAVKKEGIIISAVKDVMTVLVIIRRITL
jgi:hypothetical protein